MKVRRKYNNWIPQLFNIGAITLYPFILFSRTVASIKTRYSSPEELFKHEFIHVEQVRRMGWFKFYFKWLVENRKTGYKQNKYELEAWERQTEPFTDEEQKAFSEDFGL